MLVPKHIQTSVRHYSKSCAWWNDNSNKSKCAHDSLHTNILKCVQKRIHDEKFMYSNHSGSDLTYIFRWTFFALIRSLSSTLQFSFSGSHATHKHVSNMLAELYPSIAHMNSSNSNNNNIRWITQFEMVCSFCLPMWKKHNII